MELLRSLASWAVVGRHTWASSLSQTQLCLIACSDELHKKSQPLNEDGWAASACLVWNTAIHYVPHTAWKREKCLREAAAQDPLDCVCWETQLPDHLVEAKASRLLGAEKNKHWDPRTRELESSSSTAAPLLQELQRLDGQLGPGEHSDVSFRTTCCFISPSQQSLQLASNSYGSTAPYPV